MVDGIPDDLAVIAAFQQAFAAAEQRAQAEIDEFKRATDDKGNLLHPRFDEFEETMGLIAETAFAEGKRVPSLGELYQIAIEMAKATRH